MTAPAHIPRLVSSYYALLPNPEDPTQKIAFGTSGHRGSSLKCSFNERHILAVSQAVCDYRKGAGITGPLFLGVDTHALSEPAFVSALEVLAANQVQVFIQAGRGYTPTPVISHAILSFNRMHPGVLSDGIVITPSHNPPGGGPADQEITRAIETEANRLLETGLAGVKRISFEKALKVATEYDYIAPYVADLATVLDMDAIAASKLSIGVDPLGGAAIDFWDPIADRYRLNLTVVNRTVDPTFAFMPRDWDGKIRMDCSSPHAMAKLIELKDRFDIAFGNDTDADRHGIVTQSAGLLNPNHFLAVCVWYLFQNRPGWGKDAAVGKTLVSSAMIDRVTAFLGRRLCETPVGFKWFVEGLLNGSFGFGGEESAGASFLRKDGTVWCTDKDGILLGLLAAEMTARCGKDPGELYTDLTEKFGAPVYERMDAAATHAQKKVLQNLSPDMIRETTLAGEPITARLSHAPGNGASIGGIKITTKNGWFAARPSGTEEIYKIYAESFLGEAHLEKIKAEAKEIVSAAFRASGV